MTTEQILSRAYADVLCIDLSKDGRYNGQRYSGIVVDYADFQTVPPVPFNMDIDYFTTNVEQGFEGVYIGVFRLRDGSRTERVGTIFTKFADLRTWRVMGMLCGDLLYRAAMAAMELDAEAESE